MPHEFIRTIRPLAQQDFLLLTSEVNHLLDAAETASCKLTQGRADTLRRSELTFTTRYISSLINQLAPVIVSWASGSPQLLSRDGIRETLIDELWACLESLFCFLIQLNASVGTYNRSLTKNCIVNLRALNKFL